MGGHPFLKGRIRSFRFAWQGILSLFKKEANAKVHLVAAFLVIALSFVMKIEAHEWVAVIICIGGVFMAEGFNTAIESIADKVSPEYDPLIGRAKDLAAGAMLLFVMAAVSVGIIIFLPYIMSFISKAWE